MDKRGELLAALIHAREPMSGEDLGARLGVSSRTIRAYVRALNRRAPLIAATHRGYVLDREVHRETAGADQTPAQTPQMRMQLLCRHLVQQPEPCGIHDLVEMLCVSESTMDSDLARARDALRRHDLWLRRDRGMIWTEGSERSRRRVVLEMSGEPGGGLVTTTWRAFCAEYGYFDAKALREGIAELVGDCALELSDYALTDVVMQLVVMVDRVGLGRTLPADRAHAGADPRIAALRDRIGELVEERYAVALPPPELAELEHLLAARAIRPAGPDPTSVVPMLGGLVAELLDEVALEHGLGRPDPQLLRNLTVHVQNLVARARAGSVLPQPLGAEFTNDHPLVHDVALCFAGRLEARLGIQVDRGELDYLALHLGMHYRSSLEDRDLVSVALVVPRYYDLAERLAATLGGILRGQAVIEELATSLTFDFASSRSDLIVSCIPPEGRASAPVVVISPLLGSRDVDQLLSAVQQAREGRARRRLRTTMAPLLDRDLFVRDDQVDSREAAIAVLCDALRASGRVDADFAADVLDREQRSATLVGDEIAVPRSLRRHARQTCIAVLVSRQGIPWGSAKVRLVFLVAVAPGARETSRAVLQDVTWLLSSRASVAALVAASQGFDQFVSAMSELTSGSVAEPSLAASASR